MGLKNRAIKGGKMMRSRHNRKKTKHFGRADVERVPTEKSLHSGKADARKLRLGLYNV